MASISSSGTPKVGVSRPSPELVRGLGRWAGIVGLLGGLGYLVLAPLFRLQQLAFGEGGQAYADAYSTPRIGEVLRTTIMLALGSLVIAMVFGVSLAWCATRLPRRLRFLRIVPLLPLVLPAAANVVGWAFLLSPRPGYLNALMRNLPWWSDLDSGPIDVYSAPCIIVIVGFSLTSFVYLFVANGLSNINSELLEAAEVSGDSAFKVFFTITLPLLRPVLLYGGGVVLLLGLGQFTAPLFLGRNQGIDVLTTLMYRSVSQSPIDQAQAAAYGSPLLLFGLVVVLGQKYLVGDTRRFVTHGGKSFRTSERPSKAAAAFIACYGFVATVLPVGALAIVALSPFWSGSIPWGEFTLENFRRTFEFPGVTEAITRSLTLSLLAVLLALPVGYAVANILVRGRNRVVRFFADLIVTLPLGVPAVIFGAGFLLTYTRPPFILYGTQWVIVLVYLTLMLPFTVRLQLSSLLAMGESYVEASRTSGASAARTHARILAPLMRPAMGSAAALMFILLTHEFTASLLVRSPTTQVMGTVLYDVWTNGQYPMVAAIALIMTVVTTAGVVMAQIIGGSDVLTKL